MTVQEISPLRSWFSSFLSSSSPKCKEHCKDCSEANDDDRWERERAFDIADTLETGMAREIVTEFTHPLRRARQLWKFQVERSADNLQYRLLSGNGDFLMYARVSLEIRQVGFFLYDPDENQNLYNGAKPAFSMSWSKDKTEWCIVQERCENCQFSPKHLTCACYGKQQIAWISHHRKPIGAGIFNCMEVQVPGLHEDGSRVVWCPLTGRDDLSVAIDDDSQEAHELITKEPSWNDQIQSLVLDFKGREIISSAKNFQLGMAHNPEHVLCQYGKIGAQTFGLDFKYPLSAIQAFGISLSTIFWT
eukprot:TRINITY_DN23342_c0_g1_i1.p1 TRINITY_DN23342_c0_g1~~TRINITY_DN23342_c0_g1_i1.p1  ORF type:complete len:304 (-),score=42.09 TRINITY_DN23342_c0_g1_i1:449-1360(-)